MEKVIDAATGEVFIDESDLITEEHIEKLKEMKVFELEVLDYNRIKDSVVLENTQKKDPTEDEESALYRIYSLLRPGDPPNVETARNLIERMFFSPKRYNLGDVGRYSVPGCNE